MVTSFSHFNTLSICLCFLSSEYHWLVLRGRAGTTGSRGRWPRCWSCTLWTTCCVQLWWQSYKRGRSDASPRITPRNPSEPSIRRAWACPGTGMFLFIYKRSDLFSCSIPSAVWSLSGVKFCLCWRPLPPKLSTITCRQGSQVEVENIGHSSGIVPVVSDPSSLPLWQSWNFLVQDTKPLIQGCQT